MTALLKVPYLKKSNNPIVDAFALLKRFPKLFLEKNNWQKDFPYSPRTSVQMAWNENGFFLHYEVEEEHVLATNENLTGNVWEDSCVEFFFSPHSNQAYYNIESNPIGARLFDYRTSKNSVKRSHHKDLEKIIVHSSLPLFKAIDIKAKTSWNISIFLPQELLPPNFLLKADQKFTGNFYKCGDKTQNPHYISWTTINISKPNFHCPQFFGSLELMPE